MDYTTYATDIANNMAISVTDDNFLVMLPQAIQYAEGRIARDLDLMAANVRDSSSSTVALTRNFNLPAVTGTFLIIDGINIITPASTGAESGTRNPLIPVSRDFLDYTWPSTTGATVPQYFAYITQDTFLTGSAAQSQVIFGPWPDSTYRVEVIGKVQPPALSSTNTTTWISVNLPDLMIAASMVFVSGWMKNYGSGADDPKMSMSWEAQYGQIKGAAATYQARARFAGASWTPKQQEPQAAPSRG